MTTTNLSDILQSSLPPGPEGASGYSGTSGFSGTPGDGGYSGISGTSGVSGYSGSSGVGRSGYSGFSGWSGASGLPGAYGAIGLSGYSGTSGASGVGTSGYSGRSGFSGTSGALGGVGTSGTSGISGKSGYSGISGLSGASGVGTSGYSGAQGPQGVQGIAGAFAGQGIQGTQGLYGLSGTSGFSGYSGAIGSLGISGYSGTSGTSGATGGMGSIGDSGYSGTSGKSGYSGTGASGISGKSGYSGSPGTQGPTGIQGFQGIPGDFAAQGIQGIQGTSGPQGIQGIPGNGASGYSGASLQGISGAQGIDGAARNQGLQGVQGLLGAGTSGYSGTSGFSGYSGISGTSGSSGISGYSGLSGFSGWSGWSGIGISGYSGFSGWSGASGLPGAYGAIGLSGYSGISGTSGSSGISGYSGLSGFSGWSGIGISGYSGSTGGAGISGYSGISGTSGSSGRSGYSGNSGFSGWSGWSGIGISGYSGSTGGAGISGYSGISGTSGSSMFITVSGFTQAAIDAAITTANANPGSTVFFPAGTYTVVNTIVCSDINIIGVGNATKIIGSSANLGSSNPIFKLSGIINVSNIYTAFDSKPVSATTGQYVIFWLGNSTVAWYGVQRPSYINYIYTGPCGTAFYNPDTSSTQDTSVFSTTFSNLRVEQFTYRGFDFRSLVRTGNVYSNIYLNTGSTGVAPNILTLSCDTLFYLGGGESESSIHQLNVEWATFTNAAISFDKCSAFTASTIHLEHLTPATSNLPFVKLNSSCGSIQAFTIYGNYYPSSPDPTASNVSIFQLNSVKNYQNGNAQPLDANYLNIDILNIANVYPIINLPKVFSRGTNDGSVYINIGCYEYATGYDDYYWQAFPTSGNLTILNNGINTTRPQQTIVDSLIVGETATLPAYCQMSSSSKYSSYTWAFGPCVNDFYIEQNGPSTYNGVYLAWGATAWSTTSDESLKDIIEPITDACEKTKSLRTVIGKYKAEQDGTRRAFLIAQDVQQVLPEAVNTNREGYLGVQYTDTIPLLTAAIKEILTRLEELESKIP